MMTDFSSKYTDANLAPDSTPYDSARLCDLVKRLEDVDGGSIKSVAPAILAVILCAQRRGDAVPKIYHGIVEGKSDDEKKRIFLSMKGGLTLAWPFVGLPNSMPACLGLVNELRGYNITVPSGMNRPRFDEADWTAKGKQTNGEIYRSAGNAEVGQMVAQYFPEMSHAAVTTVFGFLVGGSESERPLPLNEIIVAAAITGLGATRQTRSHFKASMGLGISAAAVKAVLEAAKEVATWNGTKLGAGIDVDELEKEAKANLAKAG